jgi:hypothetical protein
MNRCWMQSACAGLFAVGYGVVAGHYLASRDWLPAGMWAAFAAIALSISAAWARRGETWR